MQRSIGMSNITIDELATIICALTPEARGKLNAIVNESSGDPSEANR